jgi:hypothetical protein
MILKPCDCRPRYKFVAVDILCAVFIQTSVLIFVIYRDLVQMNRVQCVLLGNVLHHPTRQPLRCGNFIYCNLQICI